MPSKSGSLVGYRLGEYELLALLAVGGAAEIYLASVSGALGFQRFAVVKCLHEHLAEKDEYVEMFVDEAKLSAKLSQTNIVQTLSLGVHEGIYYMGMEYLPGMSLALMRNRAAKRLPGGRIPDHIVLGIGAQVCAGLGYAHGLDDGGIPLGIVHRDISPQNLVVTFEGVVKIVDFGIAKNNLRDTETKAGLIKGKFAYMSPEQCRARDIDLRTDIFALGIILHELLTGKRLFKRESPYQTYKAVMKCDVPPPSHFNHELDPALDPLVMKALALEPNDRYQSASEFGQSISAELHRRGKTVRAQDLGIFLRESYAPEVARHVERVQKLEQGLVEVEDELTWNSVVVGDSELLEPESELNLAALAQPVEKESSGDEQTLLQAGLQKKAKAPKARALSVADESTILERGGASKRAAGEATLLEPGLPRARSAAEEPTEREVQGGPKNTRAATESTMLENGSELGTARSHRGGLPNAGTESAEDESGVLTMIPVLDWNWLLGWFCVALLSCFLVFFLLGKLLYS